MVVDFAKAQATQPPPVHTQASETSKKLAMDKIGAMLRDGVVSTALVSLFV
jgi:hypothetical protein